MNDNHSPALRAALDAAGGVLPRPGWVYILTNPGLPGVVKIGLTTRDTLIRSTELLREYGTVYPFALASRHAVSDCAAVEAGAIGS